ncbi:MAG: aspartate kinase [Bacteroidales bacterium]
MRVMKFGGTSVQNAEAVERLINIVKGKLEQSLTPIIVVSALSGVTNDLYEISNLAIDGFYPQAKEIIDHIEKRHLEMCKELAVKNTQQVLSICQDLKELVRIVSVLGELSERSKARIISTGEILSSNVISLALNAAGVKTSLIDSKKLIITDQNYLKAEPNFDAIQKQAPDIIGKALKNHDAVITQGFQSASENHEITVLGRGGSDYTASLLGMAINADEIEIWTDVDGVHTTDPRRVSKTHSIKSISFEEAAEMAQLGAKVLHPLTIQPALMKNIPVRVMNSLKPDLEGTLILPGENIKAGVKSISCKENIVVVNIFTPKMINTFGFLNKIFEIFNSKGVSVDLISTSEANVSVTIDSGENWTSVIDELSQFAVVNVEKDKAQVSVVGKEIFTVKEICSRIFGCLSEYNISMISAGASSINVSFVTERSKLNNVIQSLHNEFFDKK